MFFSGIYSLSPVQVLALRQVIPHARLNRYASGLNVDHTDKALYRNHLRANLIVGFGDKHVR